MMPVLIESWGALPRRGEAWLEEREWFDVKQTYGPKSQAEMAKDLAAFANTLGGAIIIGAVETPEEPNYTKAPLPADYAQKVHKELDEAVREFCRPSPRVHVRTIQVPDIPSRVVLVANVEAHADGPVAARHEDDADAWRFPHRVGRHTEFLRPEDLPLLMNSRARRAKLLLLRAKAAGNDIVEFFCVPAGSMKHANIQGSFDMKVEEIDPGGGGSVLLRGCTDRFKDKPVAVPFEDVEALWLQHTGRWAIRVAGRLETFNPVGDGERGRLIYTPPSTFVVSPLGRVLEDLANRVRDIGRTLESGTLAVQHSPRSEPTENEIRQRAHEQWLWRSEEDLPGSAEEDWEKARRQLLAERRGV